MLVQSDPDGIGVHVDESAHGRWREEPYYTDLLSLAYGIQMRHMLVWIYQYSGRHQVSYALDAQGDVLEIPDDYKAITIVGVPLLRIRKEHDAAFVKDLPWISDPLRKLYEAVSQLDVREGASAWKSDAGLAMQEFNERLRERGWMSRFASREIMRISG
jgi:hypothetical protein